MSVIALENLAEEIAACRMCPRLVAYREDLAVKKRASFMDWTYWARGVPGFGDPNARVLVIGLAPGAHGANRTGRVFTGDASGKFLWKGLHEAGFASQPTSDHIDDGLVLNDLYVNAALRCVPPQDKPSADELSNCRPFLAREIGLLPEVRLVLALGRVGFEAFIRFASEASQKRLRLPFKHGEVYEMGEGLPSVLCCFHPSPRNTNTGKLKYADLVDVLHQARALAGLPPIQG
ncbi:MAG: Uracil-DNA glycosylase [Chloroflexi bacterium]|nr:MAG: Uracil-DNA glycosylase [Chloroflexota bacterium]